jgi:hypothetical protein
MNHLDEGTIHAWLDGSLSATQSAEVDAHLKSCAECSATVAEARGLIAASSRILMALDDVPANVIPKPVAAPVRRRWGAAPWISGLAAAAIIVTLWRTGGVEQPTRGTEIEIPELKISTGLPEPSLAPVPPPSEVVASRSAEIQQSRQSVAKASPAASGRGAGAVGSVSASDLAANQPAPPLAPVPAAAESRATALRDERLRRESVSEVVVTAAADGAGSDPIAGCYRLPAQMLVRPDQVTAGAADAVAARTARPEQRRAVASAAPAAAPSTQQKATADAALPSVIVRLDTLGRVRSGADSIGSWVRLPGDSARVVANLRSAIVSGADKVRCP